MPENKNENETESKSSTGKNLISEVYTGSAEETFFRSPMVPDSYMPPYNPDDIYQKAGDYSIYEEMLQDDQVSVCMNLKKDLVLGSGFEFISEDDNQEEIIEDLYVALDESVDIPFLENIEEMLSAYAFGFSISEKLFKVLDSGQLHFSGLKTRHPNSWLLFQDDKGNITKYEQNTSNGPVDVDPKKLIHYVNNRKFQNPYGTSDLRASYAAWFAKRQVVKYFGIFLEKSASPIPVGRYPKDAPKGTAAEILNILKRFQTKTAITIPKEIEVEFLEAKSTGDAYSKAINIFNMFIGRSLFVPDLIGLTGSETGGGSYSLGKEQMKLFFMHINRRRHVIEKLINKHIVWPIVVYNHGFVENYPKFRFKPIDDSDSVELAKVWLEAVKGNLWKPNDEEINYFRALTKFPEGDVEEKEQPMPLFGGPQNMPPNNQPPNNKQPDSGNESEQEKPESEQSAAPKQEQEPEPEAEKKSNFGKIYDLPDGDYHKKVNFKAIETKLNDYDQSVLDESSRVVRKIMIDLFDQIEKKKIVQNQKVDRIDNLSLKYKKELKQILKASFTQLYKDSQNQAATEIQKTNFAKVLSDDKWLEVIENETFQYIGDWEYSILKKTRAKLIAAIKDGKPLTSLMDELRSDLLDLSDVSIERFARTKHTEVMNNARKAYFDDTGVVAGYQYSAILDGQTSDICRGLNNKKFLPADAPVPPMHFNCRSVLIPITIYEKFTPTETIKGESVDVFIDENKGDGFSKYASKKKPEITDQGVEFETVIDGLVETTTYSKDGKAFQVTEVLYNQDDKTKIVSIKHKRLDDDGSSL